MTPAIVAECASDILQAFVEADMARLESYLAEAESARDAAVGSNSADSVPFDLLAKAVSSIQALLERIEQQQLQNREDLEQSYKLLLLLAGRDNTAAQPRRRLQ
jgi:hypothetical protein